MTFLLFASVFCASPEVQLVAAKEKYLTDVLSAQNEFAQSLDRKVAEVLEADLEEATRLKRMLDDLRLGLFKPSDNPLIYEEQRRYLDAVEDATSALSEAYSEALKHASTTGDLESALKIRREHEQFVEGTYEPSIADTKRPEVTFARYVRELKMYTPITDQRIPDELTITGKRRHVVINGIGKFRRIWIEGQQAGWFGKAVVLKHRRPLNGLLRSTVPPADRRLLYTVSFVKGDKAIDTVALTLEANVTYEWSLRNVRGVQVFTLTREGNVELERRCQGSANLAFTATVRYPNDRAALHISF